MKKEEVIDAEVEVVEEKVTEVAEAKKESWIAKPVQVLKKHGKKILVVTLVGLGTAAGYALGSNTSKSKSNSTNTYGDDYTSDSDDYESADSNDN